MQPYIPTTDLKDQAEASWGDAPAYHTPGRDDVYPGRRVLVMDGVTWPHDPEECPGSAEFGTLWLFEDTVMVCQGCGLDST